MGELLISTCWISVQTGARQSCRSPGQSPCDSCGWCPRDMAISPDLVEPAKAAALDKLDEGQRALGIASDWVRTKLGV
jgi:hypothetical protein